MPNNNSESLAARTILAIILMIGFYLLALAVVTLLLFLIYLEIVSGSLNIYLTLICLFAAGVILWSIIPRSERFLAPGPVLSLDKYPQLFTELKSISKSVGQEMPAEVYLVPDVNAFVTQVGGTFGLGSRRIMGIGLPLFSTLTISQLRAVLSHEFGHYYGGDTRLGPWVYRTRSMVIRTVSGLRSNNTLIFLIRLPFYGYGKMFLRITLAISRRQEYNADKLAGQVAGPDNLIQALRTIRGVAPAWEAYWNQEFTPVFGLGFIPPLTEGFNRFLKAKPISQKISDIVAEEMKEARTNPYDSHPSIKDRVAALEAMPVGAASVDNSPAISLISDIPQLEMAILRPIVERHHLPSPKVIDWDELVRLVYIPDWKKTVQQQSTLLKGLTPEKLPEVAGKIGYYETLLSGAANLNSEQRQGFVFRTIGVAITLALLERGWEVRTSPGELVTAFKYNQQIECFNILPRLKDSTLPADAWFNNCRNLGITGIDLSQVAGPSTS